jgi:tagatose-1,6-bisphosphate aldolase
MLNHSTFRNFLGAVTKVLGVSGVLRMCRGRALWKGVVEGHDFSRAAHG